MINIVFVTNYFNHHQAPLAECLDIQSNHHFIFIETEPIAEERKNMGWTNDNAPLYVRRSYVSERERDECQKLIDTADVVIWGSCPFNMIRSRLKAKKLTFCYSERLFKKGFGPIAFGGRAIKHWLRHCIYQKNHYLLCASAYARSDYERIGLFRNKAYKWGYFPDLYETKNVEDLISKKKEHSILWAGRMIDWKHPEIPVILAKRLKDDGLDFHLDMIGNGDQKPIVEHLIEEFRLSEYVSLHGSMPPNDVRTHMEAAEIYLFTSDQNEGWGAVVNEAMSSACAVIASDSAGSVRYLIEKDTNGLVYHNSNTEELYRQVVGLLQNRRLCQQLGKQAHYTVANQWSAQNAATRFIALALSLLNGDVQIYTNGPCSKA